MDHLVSFTHPLQVSWRQASAHRRGVLQVVAATSPRPKKASATELRTRVEELEQENSQLRAALAAAQGCAPEDVQLAPPKAPRSGDEVDIDELLAMAAVGASPSSSSSVPPGGDVLAQLEAGIAWASPGESPPFWDRPARSAPLYLPSGPSNDVALDQPPVPLHIVHVTAEMAPAAKVGGLGDVVPGLAKACIARGATVDIILPFYECLSPDAVDDLTFDCDFECPKGKVQDGVLRGGSLKTQAWRGTIDGCPVILLRPDWEATGSPLFRGGRIYGGSYNEAEAYLYFCRAALEYLVLSGRQPDVIHAHEWQASAVPMLFWETFSTKFYKARPVSQGGVYAVIY